MRSRRPGEITIPEMVRAELIYGAWKSKRREENLRKVEAFLAPFTRLPFVGEAVEHYGEIRAGLETFGEVIGPYDLIIAATARSCGGVLVTNNVNEFSRVPGLKVEDWGRAD
jgi:tRNA(fMet)-specific endonuclease VapC